MLKHLSLLLLLGCLISNAHAQELHQEGATAMSPKSTESMPLYIGTYTHSPQEGIALAHFNAKTGELSAAQTVAATPNASFLALSPNGQFLYAANEWGPVAGENQGGLSAFHVEPGTGQLSPLNAIAVGGNSCHLTTDATGKWLLVAAYGSGITSTWFIQPDGSIGQRAALIQHTGRGPNEQRQSSPHSHHIVLSPDNARAFVADLGVDQVVINQFDATTGQLKDDSPASVSLAGGSGPRHLALSPSGQFLYVVSELSNTVTAFKDALGTPQQLQIVSTLPADFTGQSFAAEIAVHPSGRFLYVSNRGTNSLACYSVASDGHLELVGFAPTGRNPRHFTFDPTGKWLLAANQNDRSITVFSIDSQTGLLARTSQLENIPGDPVCLLFVQPSLKN